MKKAGLQEDAEKTVAFAVKVPSIVCFEEVLDLDALKFLQKVHSPNSLNWARGPLVGWRPKSKNGCNDIHYDH